jgi:HK97 family phage prohead protease
MGETLRRAFSGDMEVRASGDGRTVCGIAVPFDTPTTIREFYDEYEESFARGAFAKTISERGDRVKFLYQHDSDAPIGKATALREDASGLYAEFRVSKTQRGDEVLELIRDGALDSFSIGFNPIAHTSPTRGHVVRTEVKLREVSAVTFPAYESALMSGVRALNDDTIKRAVNLADEFRAGSQLSAQNLATLKHVLSLVSAADRAVDEVQPLLAALLGVPNPDVAQDAESASEAPRFAGLDVETARRKARLLGVRF